MAERRLAAAGEARRGAARRALNARLRLRELDRRLVIEPLLEEAALAPLGGGSQILVGAGDARTPSPTQPTVSAGVARCLPGIPTAAMSAANAPETLPSLPRRLAAECVGTALLLAAVVGSGIMGERLAGGNVAIALLANTIATGAALVALILAFGPISGAHFNPAVTLADASQRGLAWREVPGYLVAQVSGAFAGVAAAHLMFAEPIFALSTRARPGVAQAFSEVVATFGLLAVIAAVTRARSNTAPFAVGAYITAAYWFTASTSFANPAVTLARAATDTFAGIRPADVPAFVTAELLGAAAATALLRWLVPAPARRDA
jgi:glycerol uptake facilitator-like aquaporin